MYNRILLISSRPTEWSLGFGKDVIEGFKKLNYEVDFLSIYQSKDYESSFSIYHEEHVFRTKGIEISRIEYILKLCKKPKKLLQRLYQKIFNKSELFLVNVNEKEPPISVNSLINSIPNKNYDFVLTLFWQGFLTAHSIYCLYNALHIPIIIIPVDRFPYTGGCANIFNCKGIFKKCVKCPASFITNPNQTNINFLYKKNIYSSIKCLMFVNVKERELVLKTQIINPCQVKLISFPLNLDDYYFRKKNEVREKLRIPLDKFVFFSGAADPLCRRKGWHILVDATKKFNQKYSDKAIIALAGSNPQNIKLEMETINLGFLNKNDLIDMYWCADVYLSPTIEDAGPSMVNQALMCGTPVVAFDLGVAHEAVKTGETGYLVKSKNGYEFFKGMEYLYLSENLENIRKNCRIQAELEYSNVSFAKKILEGVKDIIN